ncbi:origin recognition complex subunit 5-like isoform X2 [Xenia sp. Carnegie-2017]|uniref:origin recognition complex subunit 5-like isoform X2 n=1 Tax=Xenia sp. Carnegie-2017 TaxID=2897299 RepID=UPI001F03E24C|nr:origin recognition complex subunit 5-like isoform X2 [Xenia sp. Carnegie-2017]
MESNEEIKARIESKVLHRTKQITTLYNLFNIQDFRAYPSIFIYGHTATGKNFVLETIFEELRAQLNFPKYCEPIVHGEANHSDVRKLWRNIEPCFRKAMSTVFLHEVSSVQWEQIQDGSYGVKGLSSCSSVELPYYSKYLLIASYLASYNPAKTDRQFFCKTGRKLTKQAKVAAKTFVKKSCHLKGPHPFILDRLMAIFYSIVDEKVPISAVILTQLSSLVTLCFLTKISSNDVLDSPKFKCMVSLEFIKTIARQLEFDLGHYLYDFIHQ